MRILISFLLVFLLLMHSWAQGLRIGYISPMSGKYSSFGQMFLNGLSIALGGSANIIMVNSRLGVQGIMDKLENGDMNVIVGPFLRNSVDQLVPIVCSFNVLDILPFNYVNGMHCESVIGFGFYVTQAARELANIIYRRGFGEIVVLYGLTPVSQKAEESFVKQLSLHGIKPLKISHFVPGLATYVEYFKNVFGIYWSNTKSTLLPVTAPLSRYSLHVRTLVVFADESDFVKLANLVGFYGIRVKHILSVGLFLDKKLASLNPTVARRVLIVTPYNQFVENPKNEYFVRQYMKTYGSLPNQISALGFDIGMVINDANPSDLRDSILSMRNYQGVTGDLLFFDNQGKGVFHYNLINYRDFLEYRKYEENNKG